MKESENMEPLRLEYLAVLTELGSLSVERASHLPSEMGMSALRSPQDASESEKVVAKVTRRIADVCNKMRAIEQRARGGIGIPAMFGTDVPNAIRVAVSILACKSFMGGWNHECRYVGNLLQPAGGADQKDLLTVREAFRKSGLLRKYIHCDPARTIDEMGNLTLSETAFRSFLALEPDTECEELFKARELVGTLGRRG